MTTTHSADHREPAPMTQPSPLPRDRMAVDISLLALRVIAGIIFAVHGAQKFGIIGDGSLAQTVEKLGVGPVGYLVAIGEFVGGLGLIVGVLTRFSAASLIVIMLGAIAMVHGKNGLFLSNGGFEFNLALIGLLLPILLVGPGRFSLSRLWVPRSRRTGHPIAVLE